MRQISQTNNTIKWLVTLFDLLILNLLIYAFFKLGDSWIPQWQGGAIRDIFLVYNLCYLYCITQNPPILQMNKVRSDEIVRRVFITVFWFALLSGIATGFMNKSLLAPKANIIFYLLLCILLWFSRLTSRWFVKKIRATGKNTQSVVFVGASSNMLDLYHEMMSDSSCGYHINGYFDDAPSPLFPANIPYLGNISQIIPFLESPTNEHIEQLYCCLPSKREKEIRGIINYCENHVVRFFSVPNVRNYLKRKMNMELLGEVPILYIREEPLQQMDNQLIKRAFDIICSGLFLCTLFPIIYLFVAVIVKMTSPGPVFFKQKRNGLNGEEFYCYKFRSMKVNTESDTLQATEHDPRKTKFGDFMRKTNIDELPQFINVFIGDMSLVGPRPHMLKHTKEYSELIDYYMVRHLIKPGITGWAQVNGCRGETKELYQMEERVRKDIWYLENWSFWLDLRIMWMTVRNMLLRNDKGAY